MLIELKIQNFAIINDLTIQFSKGLNIITGETGAGKSIIIDALGIAMGMRADQEVIRSQKDYAQVEAIFDITSNEPLKKNLMQYNLVNPTAEHLFIVKRIISKSGKNKIFVNENLTTRIILAKLTEELVQVSSQHESQTLLRSEKQLSIIDDFCGHKKLISKLKQSFSLLKQAFDHLVEVSLTDYQNTRHIQFLNFQIQEIEKSNLIAEEDADLEGKKNRLKHSQKLLDGCSEVESLLYTENDSAYQKLNRTLIKLRELVQIDSGFNPFVKGLEDLRIVLEETVFFVRQYLKSLDHNPMELEHIEDRLQVINSLKKKYGKTIEEIFSYLEKIKKESDLILNKEQYVKDKFENFKELYEQTLDLAYELSENRKKKIEVFEKEIEDELHQLGLGNASFLINIHKLFEEETGLEFIKKIEEAVLTTEGNEEKGANLSELMIPFNSHGLERLEFLISTNKGENLKPLLKVASGGELSRIMLSIKNVSKAKGEVGIYIFDEVDTGLGGAVAEVVGRKLKRLASSNQVICITHLPQIAVFSDNHLFVSKITENQITYTTIKRLSKEERIQEISRMLAGINITSTTMTHARELIRMAENISI